MKNLLEQLLQSQEPAIRFKALTKVKEFDPKSDAVLEVQNEIRESARVKLLLSEQGPEGQIAYHPYAKWYGAHWVLAQLADIGYPAGDQELIPMRDQVLEWLFSDDHWQSIRTLKGRTRIHASQEGNALYALLALGLADARVDELAQRLVGWQWPDGGWNCDKKPEAINSSFHESLIPMRGLALHAKVTGNEDSRFAAERTSEIFLKRCLFRSERGGQIIHSEFKKLHYPAYWHYDILSCLKVLAEAGHIDDPRCEEALDLLESKQLPGGGWPAENKYYRVTDRLGNGRSLVDWGGTSKLKMNEWVTVDALFVLNAAGRLAT
jgi:hypothetical protein